jgi:RNA polymerase sigma-70 factor (ECF subfamily)
MAEPMSLSTSPTLLEQLRAHPGNRGAWDEFVGRYAPRIRIWCRRSGLQEADVEDAVQAVLVRLARGMAEFRYDPSRSFRAYLKSLTRYAVCDLRAAFARPDAGCGGSRVDKILAGVRARDDLMRHLEDEFDLELLREAMRRVSRRVEPTTWEAFRLVVEDGLPSQEAADRLGIKVARVYVAKSRVLALVKQEIRTLGGDPEDGDVPGSREGPGDGMLSER